jgi:hypothetical protein
LIIIDDLEIWRSEAHSLLDNVRAVIKYIESESDNAYVMVSTSKAMQGHLDNRLSFSNSFSTVINLNKVAGISSLIIISIYLIRYVLLKIFLGKDILPQLFIAPRGLITVLLFYAIPEEAILESFEPGILLFVIIVTSLIMTTALIYDKRRSLKALDIANDRKVGTVSWKAPTVNELK